LKFSGWTILDVPIIGEAGGIIIGKIEALSSFDLRRQSPCAEWLIFTRGYFAGQAYRSTESVIFRGVEGTGRRTELSFVPRDVFTVPNRTPYRIETDDALSSDLVRSSAIQTRTRRSVA
jgi:hypothetical protein